MCQTVSSLRFFLSTSLIPIIDVRYRIAVSIMHPTYITRVALAFMISAAAALECALCHLDFSGLTKDTGDFVHGTKDYAHEVVEDVHSVFSPREHPENDSAEDALHSGPIAAFVDDTKDYAEDAKDYALSAGEAIHDIAEQYVDHAKEIWDEDIEKYWVGDHRRFAHTTTTTTDIEHRPIISTTSPLPPMGFVTNHILDKRTTPTDHKPAATEDL